MNQMSSIVEIGLSMGRLNRAVNKILTLPPDTEIRFELEQSAEMLLLTEAWLLSQVDRETSAGDALEICNHLHDCVVLRSKIDEFLGQKFQTNIELAMCR